jgi:hypothetical protein
MRRERPSPPALGGTHVGAADSHRSSLRGGFKRPIGVRARDVPRLGRGAGVQIGSLEQRWDCLTPICSIFEQNVWWEDSGEMQHRLAGEGALDDCRGRSHDTPHRGERAKLLDGLHRRHRRPGRRGGLGKSHRRALRVAPWAQRSWRQCRPHPHLPRGSSRRGEARQLTGGPEVQIRLHSAASQVLRSI